MPTSLAWPLVKLAKDNFDNLLGVQVVIVDSENFSPDSIIFGSGDVNIL